MDIFAFLDFSTPDLLIAASIIVILAVIVAVIVFIRAMYKGIVKAIADRKVDL